MSQIFPARRLFEAFGEVDDKMEALPGLRGMRVATAYAHRVQPMLEPDARWTPSFAEGSGANRVPEELSSSRA
jgi:hypothetical protein